MTRHAIIIGANFGDEGKGLMTDYFAEKLDARYIARFNGGAQAGHTVERNGLRHVFSSYSAGTLSGRETILTSNFIINPFAICREYETLRQMGVNLDKLTVSRSSPVTTPFDVVINQKLEILREQDRRVGRLGSCGLGINETVTRHIEMLRSSTGMNGAMFDLDEDTAEWISKHWFQHRLNSVVQDNELWSELKNSSDEMLEQFKTQMSNARQLMTFKRPLSDRRIVYEGAQGLALDEFMGEFPHVTRSNTGISNALDHINTVGGEDVVAVYVTRSYLTRHGAGPLDNEMPVQDVLGEHYVDETNVANEWQQEFRYAPLDISATAKRIKADLQRNKQKIKDYGLKVVPMIAMTFMDRKEVLAVKGEGMTPTMMKVDDIAQELQEQSGIIVGWKARGRTADSVESNQMKHFL